MKHYLNLILAVMLAVNLNASSPSQATEYTFTIHVGAFVNPQITDFQNIRSFGYVYAQPFNNLKQIYMGDYPTELDANKILAKVNENGYPDAFVTRRSLDNGASVSVIQLGAEKAGDDIDWLIYTKAGPLQTYQAGNSIKVITGPFANLDDAQSRLTSIKKAGFKDAFIKNINSVLLHRVTAFETGGGIQIPTNYESIEAPDESEKEIVVAEIPARKNAVPDVMVKKGGSSKKGNSNLLVGKEEPIPTSYETVAKPKTMPAAPKSPVVKKKFVTNTIAMPNIRGDVKRTSVLKLQELLKVNGMYKSSLDGFYGSGTKKGFEKFVAEDRQMQKYKLLSEFYATEDEPSFLQASIYEMGEEVARSVSKLKADRSSISKAYQAYGIYELAGKNVETDKLMNQALKEVFSKTKQKNKPPFNYSAGYSYSDHRQLVKHLLFVHSASKDKTNVPSWLFEKHNKEAMAALTEVSEGLVLQEYGNIMDWESLQLLETILIDMSGDKATINAKAKADNQSMRALLLLSPEAQSIEEYKAIDQWNTKLQSGLDKWSSEDPLHTKITTPLKVSYFKSWALLEDYFMNKGFSPKESRGLSLSVLKTVVSPYLSRILE